MTNLVNISVEHDTQTCISVHGCKQSEIGKIAYQLAGLEKGENRLKIKDSELKDSNGNKFFVSELQIGNVRIYFYSEHY